MRWLASVLALVALTAQAPFVAHHFEYSFDSRPDIGTGTQGTTVIDIVGIAADGGEIVRATDTLKFHSRPRQTIQCEVYSGGTVRCTQPPFGLSEVQREILPMFADGFFRDRGPRAFEEFYDPSSPRHIVFDGNLESGKTATTVTLDTHVRYSPDDIAPDNVGLNDGTLARVGAPHWHDVDTIVLDPTNHFPMSVHSEYTNERALHAGGGAGTLDIRLNP